MFDLGRTIQQPNITNDEITQTTKDIDSLKDMFENIETTKINDILIRSRAEHIENNERNTKYIFS